MASGRKSLKDELGVIRRYADLTEPYFKFLKEMLESEDKDEKKWACEQLKTAFPKFIPQTLEGTGDDGEFIVKTVSYGANASSQVQPPSLPTSTS